MLMWSLKCVDSLWAALKDCQVVEENKEPLCVHDNTIALIRITIAPCQSNLSKTPHDSSFIRIIIQNMNHLSPCAKYNENRDGRYDQDLISLLGVLILLTFAISKQTHQWSY